MKGGFIMEKKYYIRCNNKLVEVSEEVYYMYYSSKRKERYFERDLKKGSVTIDMEEEKVHIKPKKETSLDEMLERKFDFLDENQDIKLWEEKVYKEEQAKRVREVLTTLSEEEYFIIQALFYQKKTQFEIANELHISQQSVSKRKKRILQKIRKMIEE